MRALITENSRLYRQLLDNILGEQGFVNDVCSTIREARKFLDSEQYQIVCVNHHLEDGHGSQLIEYCNNHEKNRRASILFLAVNENAAKLNESLSIDKIVIKRNLQQVTDQIVHFCEQITDRRQIDSRILFVEDSRNISSLIISNLSQAGYNITHYSNGEDAWQDFKDEISYGSDKNAYDLVITDINLEGAMSGKDLVCNIRSIEDARGFVPVIAITGENNDALRLSLYQSGVSDFLHKPILIEELLIRVDHFITNKRLLDKVHDQRRELYALATIDKLTGCHNRNSLMDYSEKFISQAFRHKHALSMMVIDLDHFKSINDTHGHAVGDVVLSEVGNLLNLSFREGDLVARFGGEEFVVLLSHCGLRNAEQKAEELRSEVEALKPHDLRVTPSIGVTSMEIGEMADFATLFAKADQCVYEAKGRGRNQVVCRPLVETSEAC